MEIKAGQVWTNDNYGVMLILEVDDEGILYFEVSKGFPQGLIYLESDVKWVTEVLNEHHRLDEVQQMRSTLEAYGY